MTWKYKPVYTHSLMLALVLTTAMPQAYADDQAQTAKPDTLQGRVTATQMPFLSGGVETIDKGMRLDLTLMGQLNSEVNQKGDEILARVSCDLANGDKVLLPSNWYMHGIVTEAQSRKRLGRDGYVEVEFDKIVSPDGEYELPFHAKFSTADNELKAIAKVIAIDSGYITEGAIGGAILSAQMTGIPMAIATHGYSVAIGAGVGASLGAIGALKRKGNIASLYTGDSIHLNIVEPINLPAFNPSLLPLKKDELKIKNLNIDILKSSFSKDPYGDNHSRLLTLDIKVDNHTNSEYNFFDLALVSDHNQLYYPSLLGGVSDWKKSMSAGSHVEGKLSFSVDKPKHKYWLILTDKRKKEELMRIPVN